MDIPDVLIQTIIANFRWAMWALDEVTGWRMVLGWSCWSCRFCSSWISLQHGLQVDQMAFVESDHYVLTTKADGDRVRLHSALFDKFEARNLLLEIGR